MSTRYLLLPAAALLLAGCASTSPVTEATTLAQPGPAMRGSVHGGQQAVDGATIQLYAVGTTGYGSAATALITSTVTTSGIGGYFNIPSGGAANGGFDCPASGTAQVYLTSTGGTPGGFGVNNNIVMIAALGACNNLNNIPFVNIDEVSTVASAFALAPFVAGNQNAYTSIGAPASNLAGMQNAMADVLLLDNLAAGTSPGTVPAGASVPSATIYTLANILASCVNSNGGAYNDGSNCGTLFFDANPGGTAGTAPTDTATVAFNIARNPGFNVSALAALPTAQAPFLPQLAGTPTDFTLAVSFSGNGIAAPSALASDSTGAIWITNSTGNTVTRLASNGTPVSPGNGYVAALNNPSAIAIDSADGAWVTNKGNNTVSRLTSSGATVAGSPYSGGGLNLPVSIAFDSNGTAWIANNGNASTTSITSAGTLTNYTPAGVTAPVAIAVNPH